MSSLFLSHSLAIHPRCGVPSSEEMEKIALRRSIFKNYLPSLLISTATIYQHPKALYRILRTELPAKILKVATPVFSARLRHLSFTREESIFAIHLYYYL